VKYKFQKNITKIISWGTSRPLAGREACLRDLFANKKLFLFAKRPSGGASNFFLTSSPLGGREIPGPTPSARSTGGRYTFSEFFPSGSPFSNFIFYPFLKKAPTHTTKRRNHISLSRHHRRPSLPGTSSNPYLGSFGLVFSNRFSIKNLKSEPKG
jgi:hypothetical protein